MTTADATTNELPSFKGVPGWEFTPLKGLDIEAFEDAAGETTRTADADELARDEDKLGTIARDGFFAARNDEAWTDGTIVRALAPGHGIEGGLLPATVLNDYINRVWSRYR